MSARQRTRVLGSPPRSGKPLVGMSGSWERLGVHLMNQPFFLPAVDESAEHETASLSGGLQPRCVSCKACREPVWVVSDSRGVSFALSRASYIGGEAAPVAWAPAVVFPSAEALKHARETGGDRKQAVSCPFCGEHLAVPTPPEDMNSRH